MSEVSIRSAIRRTAAAVCGVVLVSSVAGTVGARAAESYTIDTAHSSVAFKVRHLVSYVTGSFRTFSGTVTIEPENLEESSVELTIETASIDTANEKRDTHLRSDEFFDVDKHPTITFKSSSISKSSGDVYEVTGTFTMHGVERVITIPVEVLGFTSHPRFGDRAGFVARFDLDRREYGIDWNLPMEAGSLVLGNEVQVEINLEAFVPEG